MNLTIIMVGGIGARFAADLPKQYHRLGGKEVIGYVVEAAKNSKKTNSVIIAAKNKYSQSLGNKYELECIRSGNTHNQTVKNSLEYISVHYPSCEKVVFLDSVRPFVTGSLIDRYIDLLDEYDSVITAERITDSLGKYGEIFIDRNRYYHIQKPESFKFPLLNSVFSESSSCTAIVQQLPQNARIYPCFDLQQNMKITYANDLVIAEALMKVKGKE